MVADQATISSLGLSGSFVGMDNQTVAIHDLSRTAQPVGSSFTNFDFIDFPVASGYPSLLANFIPFGSGNPANCSTNTASALAGQTCTLTAATTPSVPGGSPFTFLNTSNGTGGCCNSSATWDISGVTADGLSAWNAIFTSEFTTSYQSVLGTFSSVGAVSDGFSGAVTVTITPIPEPATMALMGAGLVLMGAGFRRFEKKRRK